MFCQVFLSKNFNYFQSHILNDFEGNVMKDIVYHVGDFSNRAETMYQLTTGNRSTGYFGTGYYFCTDWELCASQGSGHRPLYSFDIKGLNLLLGFKYTHDSLKSLNQYMMAYPLMSLNSIDLKILYDEYESCVGYDVLEGKQSLGDYIEQKIDYFKDDDENYSYEEHRDSYLHYLINKMKKFDDLSVLRKELESDRPNFKKINKEFNLWKDIYFDADTCNFVRMYSRSFSMDAVNLHCSDKKLAEICEEIYNEHRSLWEDNHFTYSSGKTAKMDSFPTMILKKLGYQGVYPSKECDNTTYGGVIFDYDDLHDIKLLADDVSEYDGIS